jgi:hypothetical protein
MSLFGGLFGSSGANDAGTSRLFSSDSAFKKQPLIGSEARPLPGAASSGKLPPAHAAASAAQLGKQAREGKKRKVNAENATPGTAESITTADFVQTARTAKAARASKQQPGLPVRHAAPAPLPAATTITEGDIGNKHERNPAASSLKSAAADTCRQGSRAEHVQKARQLADIADDGDEPVGPPPVHITLKATQQIVQSLREVNVKAAATVAAVDNDQERNSAIVKVCSPILELAVIIGPMQGSMVKVRCVQMQQ